MDCPCHSQKAYEQCCKPFHEGALPDNALQLMRSRYAAYALGLFDYLMQTTHPDKRPANLNEWKQDIIGFSHSTKFTGLTILEFKDGETEAFVTFKAHLRANQDLSFTEQSRFVKENGKWFYREGKLQ